MQGADYILHLVQSLLGLFNSILYDGGGLAYKHGFIFMNVLSVRYNH